MASCFKYKPIFQRGRCLTAKRKTIVTKLKYLWRIILISALACFLSIGCASTPQIADQENSGKDDATAIRDSQRKAAEELLYVLDIKNLLQRTTEQMLDLQIQRNPSIKPYKNMMMEFFSKYVSYESLKDELITMYSESYNENELREIIKFYKTPTGQKAIHKMPELMRRGAQLGLQRLENNKSELEEMIEKESERIQHDQE